ncbi:S-adenosyl-L-methionine-dependent methyltransferase [Hyaloscypha variabilis F]|uniref:S-adenosyl-L-methionine-dependent methyltransferase n=1 Tax=Hyaloscypha variabilis (strain UAMH 11265 / GT02V1 / F) TaxID=1149755 RepID=A0A2J6QT01_HYAVF|nr:S-adenosyl-L-methionine-dependent methyltransferase [Hyaloscypha variabilis F]
MPSPQRRVITPTGDTTSNVSPVSEPTIASAESVNPDGSDADSAYAGSILQSETSSLDSSILKYREENGRTYHSYGSTEHWGPNDEQAQDQQDLSSQSHRMSLTWELGPVYGQCRLLPFACFDQGITSNFNHRDVADIIPTAIVKGIDVSPIQPAWIPPNLKFEVDDYNKEWIDINRYDLIHVREILGTVPDWVAFYKKALNALRPGGWIDHTEPSIYIESIHSPLQKDHPFTGVTFDVAPNMKKWMEEAGFVKVSEKIQRVAVGKWPKDKQQKELGAWNQLRLDTGLRDFTERRMRNVLNWENDEILVLVAKCRAAVSNSREGLYLDLYHVYGQKPEETK